MQKNQIKPDYQFKCRGYNVSILKLHSKLYRIIIHDINATYTGVILNGFIPLARAYIHINPENINTLEIENQPIQDNFVKQLEKTLDFDSFKILLTTDLNKRTNDLLIQDNLFIQQLIIASKVIKDSLQCLKASKKEINHDNN